MDVAQPKWTTPQPDWLHPSEEALPIRSEHCQNTKFPRSRHWKWSRLADDDLPPSTEKKSKPKHTILKFDLEKLKDPNVLETFQAMIGGRFAPLTIMSNEDTDSFSGHHLQHSSDWNSQWDPWQTSSEEKNRDHCRNVWSVRQEERTEKKKDLSLKDLRNTRK